MGWWISYDILRKKQGWWIEIISIIDSDSFSTKSVISIFDSIQILFDSPISILDSINRNELKGISIIDSESLSENAVILTVIQTIFYLSISINRKELK